MAAPLVSVLVPTRNAEGVVACAVRSILEQSVGDLELIASDDCSTDATPEVLEGLARQDPRMRVMRSTTRRGMTSNWNHALAAARGRYVAKLDCDDMARPGFLERLLLLLEGETAVPVAFCRTLTCDSGLEPMTTYAGDRALLLAGMDPLQPRVMGGHQWYQHSFEDIQLWHSNALLVRREMLERLGGWDRRFGCASDTDLILRMLECGTPVAHSPVVGIWYRTSPGTVSDTARSGGWLRWEGMLAHVLSLQRATARGIPLSPALAIQRRRHRANLDHMLSHRAGEIATFPAEVATQLRSLIAEVRRCSARERASWALRTAFLSWRGRRGAS